MKLLKYVLLIILLGTLSCSNRLKVSELKVALASDFYPFAYTESDTLKGMEIELLSLLENRLKVPVKVTVYYFGNLLETFLNEDYDFALGGVTITDSRRDIFDFSMPYYDATQTVVALQNNPIAVDSLAGIASHRVGVLNNSTSLLLLENSLLRERTLPVNNLRRFNSLEALFTALENDEVSLILLENSVAELACEEKDFRVAYKHFLAEHYALVFKRGSNHRSQINRTLERILGSEEWVEIKKVNLL